MKTSDQWKLARALFKRSKKEVMKLEDWLKYDLSIIKRVLMIKNREQKK
jgi:hypothetical protein